MRSRIVWITAAVCAAIVAAQDFAGRGGGLPMASPFTPGCTTPNGGSVTMNSQVEPYVASNPRNPEHLVGVWQQDRWTNGGANGLMAAASMNGGRTWSASYPHFSACSAGTYARASDPWVAISPDGTAHMVALGFNNSGNLTATVTSVLVSRSADGGYTWSYPNLVATHSDGGDDKEAITADPNDPRYVYIVWDRPTPGTRNLPSWFARTVNGGLSWEPAHILYDPPNASVTGNQIVVLADGTVVDIFDTALNGRFSIAAMRSTDHGVTWSEPVAISTNESIGTVNAKTQEPLRTGSGLAAAAADRTSNTTYVVWPDSRFSGRLRDGIAFSKSTDGGLTWSAPVQVNQATSVQAFTPAVAVGFDGSVAVTYYDFRQDTDDRGTLFAHSWRIVSHDGGATWTETPAGGPFDMQRAAMVDGPARFMGDYQGLAAAGRSFLSFFVAESSVYATVADRAGDTSSRGRTEINRRPQAPRVTDEKKPPRRQRK